MDDETIGFEDNLDALEAELKKRDARRKANKPLPRRVVAAIKEMIRRDSDVQTLENEPDPMEIAPDAEREASDEGETANAREMEEGSTQLQGDIRVACEEG
jgi:hypothetical protein